MLAGILPFGLSDMNSGVAASFLRMSTVWGSYANPISSNAIDTFTPFGVGNE
jgi:hypothetical protein